MPALILSDRKETGGILHLPEALRLFPEAGHTISNRVSTFSQAGPGKVKLAEKTHAVFADYWRIAPPTQPWSLFSPPEVPEVFQGVEEGKLSKRRRVLEAAVRYCREQDRLMILIASDLSRFIRPEACHRQRNPDVWPTPAEFEKLRKITEGVILATILDPWASESERHGPATKRTGKAGRKPKINHYSALRILDLFEQGQSRNEIAKNMSERNRVPLSKSAVQRFLESPVPGREGLRWQDCEHPLRTYTAVLKKSGLQADLRSPYRNVHSAFE